MDMKQDQILFQRYLEKMEKLTEYGKAQDKKVLSALKLRELVKEEIKNFDKRSKSQARASGTPNKLREYANYLQSLIKESEK